MTEISAADKAEEFRRWVFFVGGRGGGFAVDVLQNDVWVFPSFDCLAHPV